MIELGFLVLACSIGMAIIGLSLKYMFAGPDEAVSFKVDGAYEFEPQAQSQEKLKYTEEDLQEFRNAVEILLTTGEYTTAFPDPTIRQLRSLALRLEMKGHMSLFDIEEEGMDVTIRVKHINIQR